MPASTVVKAPKPSTAAAPAEDEQDPITAALTRRRYQLLPENPMHEATQVWTRDLRPGQPTTPVLQLWRFCLPAPGARTATEDAWEVRLTFDTGFELPAGKGTRAATAWATIVLYTVQTPDLLTLVQRLEEMLATGMRALTTKGS